ncbi:hypothetical protein PLUTE_a4932 [Pseudoalteromonas luteoviolacea DSM 6061]|nr:hypothetical protein [Pseudoalteromonas luteoviolacea DSM 6061]
MGGKVVYKFHSLYVEITSETTLSHLLEGKLGLRNRNEEEKQFY